MRIYKILSTLFWFIRQFCIPNPFDALGEGITVMISGTPVLLTPLVLNWLAGLFLPGITFAVAGIYYYITNADSALGCVLYMVFFCVHSGILHLISLVYPATWLIILICVAYIFLHIVVISLINKCYFI